MKYILPGMGADSKMYTGPWRELQDSCFIDWPPYNNEKTIADVAEKIIDKFHINGNDIVIGSSLGGMVGLEIARILGLKKIFLVGSALNPKEISFFSKCGMPFAKKPIIKFLQWIASFSDMTLPQMFSESDPDFIVFMSKAIMNWEGFKRIKGQVNYCLTDAFNATNLSISRHDVMNYLPTVLP